MKAWSLVLSCLLAACSGSSPSDPGNGDPPTTVSFALDILPIFQQECIHCHGGAGNLDLDSYQGLMDGGVSGPVVIPGQPDDSLLPKRLDGTITPQMPADGPPLSSLEIDRIRQWILEGALDN